MTLALPVFVAGQAAEPADWRGAADAFGRTLASQFRELIYEASAVDPISGEVDRTKSRMRRREQKEYAAWFERRGRKITLKESTTEEDRRYFRRYSEVMADRDLMALKPSLRRRYCRKIDARCALVAERFATALDRVVFAGASDADAAELRRYLNSRLADPITLKTRYFRPRQASGIAAMYMPGSKVIYLNVNMAAPFPAALIDAVDHELWHHLLPTVDTRNVAKNVWWEGFNEALSEMFDRALDPAADADAEGTKLEYPVQTAFATLFLATDRAATVLFLAGKIDRDEFTRRLLAGTGEAAADGKLRNCLAELSADAMAMPEKRQKAMEKILANWGWKEDDRAPIRIDRLVQNARLDREALNKEFFADRQFFFDIVQALTVIHLQEIRRRVGTKEIVRVTAPQAPLDRNLTRVLKYVRDPYLQLSNR